MAATFEVEDGTSKTNSNSYCSVANADQYNDNHNADTDWSGAADAAKQKALRLATAYLDNVYGDRWAGLASDEDQALDWPRTYVPKRKVYYYDSDEMPQALIDATAELAIISNAGTTLLPNLTSPGVIKREKIKADVLERDVEYLGGKSPYTTFSTVDGIIAELIVANGKVSRA